jgi:hypothetical protein
MKILTDAALRRLLYNEYEKDLQQALDDFGTDPRYAEDRAIERKNFGSFEDWLERENLIEQ